SNGLDCGIEQHGRRLDVLRDYAAVGEVILDDLIKLLGQEMKRHEGAAIGVDQDDVVLVLRLRQEQPSVAVDDLEVRFFLDAEIFFCEIEHRRIELDGGDRHFWQEAVQVPRGAAAAKTDLEDRVHVL